jgi:peptidoglycan/xylan/chitin deacetylase (PgdA/CDA1 family)
MPVYLIRTPKLIQRWFSGFTWTGDYSDKRVYLTFDDGPIPGVTPWVLEQLAQYNAKATFFCVGENAERYPEVLQQVIAAGHSVGNHTHNHLSGWSSEVDAYVQNVDRCAEVIDSRLFRPPYGRLSPRKAQILQRKYRIVMWDVLSGDFDQDINPLACLRNVLDNVKPGSIVVFHDSIKSEPNLRYVLPRTLEVLSNQGYTFSAIPQQKRSNSLPAANARAFAS